MYNEKILSYQNLDSFNFEATKKNLINYFANLEKLQWEWAKLNGQKGIISNYDFSVEYTKQPYIPINKDEFNMSVKSYKEEQLKSYISGFYWAKSVLSNKEQIYINEYFVNHKFENDFVDMVGYSYSDSYGFKRLKRSAIYKFADFLNLVVEN